MMWLMVLGAFCLSTWTQDPTPKPTPQPVSPQIATARLLFQQSASTHEGLQSFHARYRQARSSLLLEEELTSSGSIDFRKQPGCVVLRTDAASGDEATTSSTIIRLDTEYYQVLRPQEKQLERFPLSEYSWPRSLFSTFSQKLPELEQNFSIESCKKTPAGAADKEEIYTIDLQPRENKGKQLTRLRLTLRAHDAFVIGVSYDDAGGDTVSIVLEQIDLNAKIPAERFELNPPQGTRVIVHSSRK